MKIRLLWVGKTQEEWVRRGIDEYAGRIRRYVPLEVAEAREEKGGVAAAMRDREGERLAKLVPKNARLVLLDERGEEMSSPGFAEYLTRCRDGGMSGSRAITVPPAGAMIRGWSPASACAIILGSVPSRNHSLRSGSIWSRKATILAMTPVGGSGGGLGALL